MPQFETTYFLSQIFWLLISFGSLYFGIRWFIFPLYDKIFYARDLLIKKPLEEAEVLLKETEALQLEIEQKKQDFASRNEQCLNQVYQETREYFDAAMLKTEKILNKTLQKNTHKLELAEKRLLKQKENFVSDVLKEAE